MFGTSARPGFRRDCGRASWRPPSDLVDHVHVSGALTGARTGKGPQMANPRPAPKPENLRPPWPPGTSGNPAGYSRGRRGRGAEGATHSLNTGNVGGPERPPNVPPGCEECPDDGSALWEDDDKYWGLQDS